MHALGSGIDVAESRREKDTKDLTQLPVRFQRAAARAGRPWQWLCLSVYMQAALHACPRRRRIMNACIVCMHMQDEREHIS